MSSGIVLGELERLLFPERYPYFRAYFEEVKKAVFFYFILFREGENPEAVLAVIKEDGYGKALRKYLQG